MKRQITAIHFLAKLIDVTNYDPVHLFGLTPRRVWRARPCPGDREAGQLPEIPEGVEGVHGSVAVEVAPPQRHLAAVQHVLQAETRVRAGFALVRWQSADLTQGEEHVSRVGGAIAIIVAPATFTEHPSVGECAGDGLLDRQVEADFSIARVEGRSAAGANRNGGHRNGSAGNGTDGTGNVRQHPASWYDLPKDIDGVATGSKREGCRV